MTRPKLDDANRNADDTVFDGEARRLPDGRRKIQLRASERAALARQQKIEQAVALFLDFENAHTWADIAEEMGITVGALKDLTKSEDFMTMYTLQLNELGHDPRLQAARSKLLDMLPVAITQLSRLLLSTQTPAGVRLKAIEKIIALNGILQPQNRENDKGELIEFLQQKGVNIEQVNIAVPAAYSEAFEHFVGEVVEGEIVQPGRTGTAPADGHTSGSSDPPALPE
jgi:hypothetical protein